MIPAADQLSRSRVVSQHRRAASPPPAIELDPNPNLTLDATRRLELHGPLLYSLDSEPAIVQRGDKNGRVLAYRVYRGFSPC